MGIGVDASHLYWAAYSDDAVMRMPKDGGPTEWVVDAPSPRDVAVAPEGIYVTGDDVLDISILAHARPSWSASRASLPRPGGTPCRWR